MQPVSTTDKITNNTMSTPASSVSVGNARSSSTWSSVFLGVVLAVLFATATFFSGFHVGRDLNMEASIFSFFNRETAAEETADLSEFWRVWHLLDEKFVTSSTTATLTSEEKVRGAIQGLVNAYDDPYTVFMPPEDASLFEQDISGNFSGVGMEIGMRDNIVTVIAPLPQSPAEKAGFLAGDSIVRIGDTSTENMSIDEAVRMIRGEKGTEIVIAIFRKTTSEFKDITVVRDTIMIPTMKTETRDNVFIITLYSFNAIAESEIQTALSEFVKSKKKRLIIDLRGNPGGYLQSAVGIGSYFLPQGKTIVRESFGEDEREVVYRSSGRGYGMVNPEKLVVLIDEGSASASEILAGALREHGAATLVGAQTFGKGSVQELINLDDGSSLKVTVARWLTPNGVSISEGGLTPDIKATRTPDDRANSRDPQLDAALEFLKY